MPRWEFAWTMRRLAAWVLEVLGEAVGTSLIVCLFVLADKDWMPPQNGQSMFAAVPLISAAVLMFFVYTGYVVTTAIAGLTLRERGKWAYPVIMSQRPQFLREILSRRQLAEIRLTGAADGAHPITRDVLEGRPRIDAAVRVTFVGVVDEAAGLADPALEGLGSHGQRLPLGRRSE